MTRHAFAALVAFVAITSCTTGVAAAADRDGDGVPDATDNCLLIPNPDGTDVDGDKIGDACDRCLDTQPDVRSTDGAFILVTDQFGCSVTQRCPCHYPFEETHTWRSRSAFLRCVAHQVRRFRRLRLLSHDKGAAVIQDARHSDCGLVRGVPGDEDGDGILDDGDGSGVVGDAPCANKVTVGCDDNCLHVRNRRQRDRDGDGRGDACDGDVDGDGVANVSDNCPGKANSSQEDADEDGVGDACDKCQDSDADADVDRHGCD